MAEQAIPKTMKALVTQANKTAKVEEVPVPEIAEDEVLVKNVAVVLNPMDWKHIENITNPGTITGCDFSGTVAKVGKNVSTVKVGDHVAGFTQGGHWKDVGAFAEYLRTPAELVWKVPDSTLSHEEAATLGCGFWTAVQALFHPTCLGLVEIPEKTSKEEWILVYGGSTSVGLFAIQLAHLAGYKVVSTASPKNFELVKSLGADAVFDYKDPDVVSKIKEVTKDSITKGLETIGTEQSQSISLRSFSSAPGKLVTILSPTNAASVAPHVQLQPTLIYTALGRAFDFVSRQFPVVPEDRAHMVSFLKKVPQLVKDGAVKPNPVKLWPTPGLEAITEGLQYVKEGKNSGEKVVHRIA
ncbi:GroES-like protein [Panus rudis PR-1116 ss-1]|nr:GroES-like protein [Panus rudis PR-1116 ss-1]